MTVQNCIGIDCLVSLKFSNSQICVSGNEHLTPLASVLFVFKLPRFSVMTAKQKTLQQDDLRKKIDLVKREEGNYGVLFGFFKTYAPS